MKTLTLLLTLTISAFSFSSEKPDFTCVEESGFTYEYYMTNYHEIHQYDENGEFLSLYDGIDVELKSIETFPSTDQFTFFYSDGKNEIAVIEFKSGAKEGHGEMVDHDQKMTCQRD